MRAAQFVLLHYGAIAVFALLAYVYGRHLTRGVGYDSAAERVGISVALGLGVISHLTFFMGIFAVLYRPVVAAVFVAGALACLPTLKEAARELRGVPRGLAARRREGGASRSFCALVGVAFTLPVLALPLYPPTAFDETSFHLSMAKVFVRSHAVVFTPFLRFQVFPVVNEMWFTLALLFYDDLLAHLFQLLCLSATVVSVFAFGRRHFSARAGVWAAALVVACPMALWCGSVSYIDISVVLFVAAAVHSFANWLQTDARGWLVLSGVFCGFAAGAKYTALAFLGLLGLVTLYRALRERSLLPPVVLSAAALAVALPCYVRNFYYTRNPLFPFLPQLFGYTKWWSAEDMEGVMHDLRTAHGVGRGAWALLAIPYHLTVDQSQLLAERPWAVIYFVVLPLTLAWSFKSRKVRLLLALCGAYTVVWFYSAQILRYLLPILPFLSLATAAAFDGLLEKLAPAARWARSRVFVAFVAAALASTGWYYAVTQWTERGPFPVRRSERDEYLARYLKSYPAYKVLNGLKKDEPVRLYSVRNEQMSYFLDGVAIGDWFGPVRYSRVLAKAGDGASLYGELKSMNVNYFLVNNSSRTVNMPEDEFFLQNFEPLYESSSIMLYRLKAQAQVEAERAPEAPALPAAAAAPPPSPSSSSSGHAGEAAQELNSLVANIKAWGAKGNAYKGLDVKRVKDEGLFPSEMLRPDGSPVNPWGGAVAVDPAPPAMGETFLVVFSGVPGEECVRLSVTPSASYKVLAGTFSESSSPADERAAKSLCTTGNMWFVAK